MLLTLHNLPPSIRYPEVKALIQSKCGSMEVILDNLVQNNKFKKVTVGLSDEGDAAIFVRKMNGVYVDGCQLFVEDSRQNKNFEQPYRPVPFTNTAAPFVNNPTTAYGNAAPAQPAMPVMQMDPNAYAMQYGMYFTPDQNAAMMGYNQQMMSGYPAGQNPMAMQGSHIPENQNNSQYWPPDNTAGAPDPPKRPTEDWDIEPAAKQSRWNDSTQAASFGNRDQARPRGNSPQRSNTHTRRRTRRGRRSRDPPEFGNNSFDNGPRDNRKQPQHDDGYQESNTGNSSMRKRSRSRSGLDPLPSHDVQGNISYPLHLYSGQDSNKKPEPRGQDYNLGFANNRNNSAMGPTDVRPEKQANIGGRANFQQQGPMGRPGFDQPTRSNASMGRPDFDETADTSFSNDARRSRFDQEPRKSLLKPFTGRGGFDQQTDSQQGRSRFQDQRQPGCPESYPESRPGFRQEPEKGRSGFGQGQAPFNNRPYFDQQQPDRQNYQQSTPRDRPGYEESRRDRSEDRGNPGPAYNQGRNLRESNSQDRGNKRRDPNSSYDGTFERSRSRDRRPNYGTQAPNNERGVRNWNEPNPRAEKAFGGRPSFDQNRKDTRPKFNKEFAPRGLGKPDSFGPPRPRATGPNYAPRGQGNAGGFGPRFQGPRAQGPNPYKLRNQPRAAGFNANRPALDVKNKPDKPKDDIQTAINRHVSSIGQAASKIAREILDNLQLENKEAKEVLKPLKKSIRARLDLIVGATVCKTLEEAQNFYRGKFPPETDAEFFEAVLQQIEKGEEVGIPDTVKTDDNKDAKDVKPSTSAKVEESAASEPVSILASMPKYNVAKGKIPKYPNSDKKLMKKQKQIGKLEYHKDDLYDVPELTQKALEQELDDLCAIFENECKDADNAHETERNIVQKVVGDSVAQFRRSLKLLAIKRILGVKTNLGLRLFFDKGLRKAALDDFLKDYEVVSCHRSVRNKNFYVVTVKTYKSYDALFELGQTEIEGHTIKIKPLHISGYLPRPSRNTVIKDRRNFIQKQIDPKVTEPPQDFIKDEINIDVGDIDNLDDLEDY